MRVLLVTDWTAERGGVETYLVQLRHGLEVSGVETRLLVSSVGDGAGLADYVAPGSDRAAVQALSQLVNPAAMRAVRSAVRDFRPDVVHVSGFELQLSPAVLAALAGTPSVVNVAWTKPVCPTGHKLLPGGALCERRWGVACREEGCLHGVRWVRELARYRMIAVALRSATAIVTCSRHMRSMLATHGLAARALDWPALPPGPSFARSRAARPVFVAAGRLSREKGIVTLIESLSRIRAGGVDACVRLVGDGPQRASIERLAARLGVADAVEITGWVEHDAVEAYLQDAWALVAPSLWAEPLGLSAVEAIVRGVPVVASAVGGYAETVEPGVTGLLCRNGDVDDLARCLDDVARGRAFGDGTLAHAAVERLARRHALVTHVEALSGIFEEISR
jgi:glycosyltransferase involved in cell wall biosynthesis